MNLMCPCTDRDFTANRNIKGWCTTLLPTCGKRGLTMVSRRGWFGSFIVFQDDAVVMLLYWRKCLLLVGERKFYGHVKMKDYILSPLGRFYRHFLHITINSISFLFFFPS